jgi:hypothetical protein
MSPNIFFNLLIQFILLFYTIVCLIKRQICKKRRENIKRPASLKSRSFQIK